MQCPNCGEKMEEERVPTVVGPSNFDLSVKARYANSTHYRCEGCDSEWTWWQGRKKADLRPLDVGGVVPVDHPKRRRSDALRFSPH